MRSVVSKTFGGLTRAYYIRQLIFSSLFAIISLSILGSSSIGLMGEPVVVAMLIACTLLYPYSRFVYEGVVGYVMGENVFFVNVIHMLAMKIFTMLMCWYFAILIAPIGLAYLYYRNSRQIS